MIVVSEREKTARVVDAEDELLQLCAALMRDAAANERRTLSLVSEERAG